MKEQKTMAGGTQILFGGVYPERGQLCSAPGLSVAEWGKRSADRHRRDAERATGPRCDGEFYPIMENKPNFGEARMGVSSFLKSGYDNLVAFGPRRNKANLRRSTTIFTGANGWLMISAGKVMDDATVMKKLVNKRFVTVVGVAGVLLVLVLVMCHRVARPPVFEFIGGRAPVYHKTFEDLILDLYCFEGHVDDVCARASAELSSRGFRDGSPAEGPDYRLLLVKASGDQIKVGIQQAQVVGMGDSPIWTYKPGWVLVQVMQVRRYPMSLWRHLWHAFRGGASPRRPPAAPPSPSKLAEHGTVLATSRATQLPLLDSSLVSSPFSR